jgi:EEF1A N-terminal glycine/lysine methyltransferase
MSEHHESLVRTLMCSLDCSTSSRILFISGLHTGRTVVANFLDLARPGGLVPTQEGVTERNTLDGRIRPWKTERADDAVERKQWLIVAQLRWSAINK